MSAVLEAQPDHLPDSAAAVRLLLIDDDQLDVRDMTRSLARAGWNGPVTYAQTVEEARTLLADETFDLVLLDYVLPDGSGLELMHRLESAPVVFVTGAGSEAVAAEAMREGAYGYVIKDVERHYLELLPETLTSVLARRRIEEEKDRLLTELRDALDHIKTLRGLIPVCASCKQIRDEGGVWEQIESYISRHAPAEFTHTLCPDCLEKYLKDMEDPELHR